MKIFKTGITAFASIALLSSVLMTPEPAYAAGDSDDCAIWLCLPGGFPSGCSGAFSAFKKRLRKGRSPLPSLSSCSGGKSSGSYQLGYEEFAACEPGYATRDHWDEDRGYYRAGYYNRPTRRICVDTRTCGYYGRDDEYRCSRQYLAPRRDKPHWVDMTIDGKPMDRYYYKMPN